VWTISSLLLPNYHRQNDTAEISTHCESITAAGTNDKHKTRKYIVITTKISK